MQRYIIDTDTASDDAVALVMALRTPGVQVDAITIVGGNVSLEQATQNALYTVELCQADVPVYAGRSTPLLRTIQTAHHVHGQDGMGDIGLPLTGRTPAPGHAADQLRERINAAPGQIALVTLGPLSNIALALLREPSLAHKVAHCYVMGGTSDHRGNVTPVSEFNIWADPEAARIVFSSGMPITMVGWDISRIYAVFDQEQAAALRAIGTPFAHFCIDIQSTLQQFALNRTKLAGFDLPDPITMAVALDPRVATTTISASIQIELSDGLCRGMTIVDPYDQHRHAHPINVVVAADRTRFQTLLERSLRA